jgi:hypothetical protein
MAGLKRYNVQVGSRGGSLPTVLLLSDADAKAQGLTDKDLVDSGKKAAAKPANKAAAPAADKSAPVSAPAASK